MAATEVKQCQHQSRTGTLERAEEWISVGVADQVRAATGLQ